jgi:hypothetical protein
MSDFTIRTFPITGGASGAVAANTIVVADAANPGSGKQSTAAARGFLGVTVDATDTKGYAAVRVAGTTKIRVGAGAITAGDLIASDANGNAVTQAVVASAAAQNAKQVVGVALASSVAGALVETLIQPGYIYG